MKNLLKEFISYQHHYNKLILDHCDKHQTELTERCLELLNHSIAAQVIWNKRIRNNPNFESDLWTNRDLAIMRKREEAHHQETLNILNEKSLTQVINYSNSKGEIFSNTIEEILFHAMNHYTYHRGQITLEFRKVGIDAIPSDYILYKR